MKILVNAMGSLTVALFLILLPLLCGLSFALNWGGAQVVLTVCTAVEFLSFWENIWEKVS